MRYKTMMSVAVLAISSAALANVTKPQPPRTSNSTALAQGTKPGTQPPRTATNSTMPMNSSTPSDSMNTQDETMMNDSSTPNSAMAPK